MTDPQKITYTVEVEHWAEEGQPSPTEEDVQGALHRALDGEFDLGAIIVRKEAR